ncbi:MAG: 16S rRNA (cytosine(1402)-N(4))-methyltransferase RsmH [Alphaproteobacteria bacterium]|nr:16S rRNA (cytosine(1402)-N(4))-methyltransferase RsmH [Alphaproteobacteria bacterium]
MTAPAPHIPVLLAAVMDALAPRAEGHYVDGTFGAGGYTRALLSVDGTQVLGIDRDPAAIADGEGLAREAGGRLALRHGRFSEMETLARAWTGAPIDGICLDLGVSSMQLDRRERGFSFLGDGPLDMRMDPASPLSAADIVNGWPEAEIGRILKIYGEEPRARAIARAIVAARAEAPITRTAALAGLVSEVMGPAAAASRTHPATRTFQALRLAVNEELDELALGLAAAERLLAPGGRIAVVAFHSLEDRMVKRFLTARSERAPAPSRHQPPAARPEPSFRLLKAGAVKADEAETAANPRARSARLRAAERTAAPVFADPSDTRARGARR